MKNCNQCDFPLHKREKECPRCGEIQLAGAVSKRELAALGKLVKAVFVGTLAVFLIYSAWLSIKRSLELDRPRQHSPFDPENR